MAELRAAQIPQHTIISRLGRGGMATVYLARNDQLGRLVAVKVIDDRFDEDQQFRQRFEREARTAAGLTHPNIVPVHEYGFAADGRPFISMAFIEGGSLRDRLRVRGPLQVDVALAITRQIASALLVAHARNIVHRDLKPDNVLFQNNTALLTDFGIAKVLDASTALTGTGANPGTVKYFSPEQAKELTIDQRSDIYALGVVLYEMLTGQLPIHGDTAMQLMMGIAHRAPEPLPPPLKGLQPFLDVLLAKEPSDRLASCADVIAIVQAMERNWLRHGEIDRLTDGVDLSTSGRCEPELPATLVANERPGVGVPSFAFNAEHSSDARTPSAAAQRAGEHTDLTLSTQPPAAQGASAHRLGVPTVDRAAPTAATPQSLLATQSPAHEPAAPSAIVVAGRPISVQIAAAVLLGVLGAAVLGTYQWMRVTSPPVAAPISTAIPALDVSPQAASPQSMPAAEPAPADSDEQLVRTPPAAVAVQTPKLPPARVPQPEPTSPTATPERPRIAERVAARREERRATEAVEPPAPAAPAVANTSALPAPPRELVVGRWEYAGVEGGEPMRIVWEAGEDGRSRYLVNPGRANVNAYAGTWTYADGVLTEALNDGRRVRADVRMVNKRILEVRILDGDRARDVRRRFRRQ